MKFERLYDLLLEKDDKLVGAVGFTNQKGTYYLPVYVSYLAGHCDLLDGKGKGSVAALTHFRRYPSGADSAQWRYVKASGILYIWDIQHCSPDLRDEVSYFLSKNNLPVSGIKGISSGDIIHGDDSAYHKSHYYTESFVDGVRTAIHGIDRYAEVFKNPSTRELRNLSSNNTRSIGAIITERDAYVWCRDNAFHYDVRKQLKLQGMSVLLLCDNAFSKCYVDVTDNTRNTEFYHKPCRKILMEHPYMKRFKILGVSYFDEDIVGSWDKMVD